MGAANLQAVLAAVITGALIFAGLELVVFIGHKLLKRPGNRNWHIGIALVALLFAIYELLNYLGR